MGDDRGKPGPLTQIIVAVVIALLVGGTSPWWWKELFPPSDGHPSSTDTTTRGSAPPKERRPTPDFAGGSKPLYSASFLQWPTVTNQYGSVGPLYGEYVLNPSSNTWVGPGSLMPITPLTADFVLEAAFRVAERHPAASIELELVGSGQQADAITAYLEIWDTGNVTYTIEKGWLKDNFYLTRDKSIAERVRLEPAIAASDWSKPNKIALKREGGVMQFFVNDSFVIDFPVSLFVVSRLTVSAAFPSKVIVTSLEARVRP